MSRYYFTYGLSDCQPFRGGWTVVEAENIDQASALFRAVHPDRTPGVLNCAGFYSHHSFEKTLMFKNKSNFGAGQQESIRLTVDVEATE